MKYKKYIFIFLLLIISYEVLTNSYEIINCINFSINLWINNIFPSLFPFIIISNLLINYGFINVISKLFNPLMRLFKCNKVGGSILVMSLISGCPSSSIFTRKLYDDGIINDKEANKILLFTHFVNPLFILGPISLFLNKKISYLILIIHYLTNIIIGFIFRDYYPSYGNNKKIIKELKLGDILSKSINLAISTLLTILGTISIFICLSFIISKIWHLNTIMDGIINGILEMSGGLKKISLLNISLKAKSIISIFMISFGGFAIHLQIISIINGSNIKYYPYLIARIIHGLTSSFLLYFLYDFII